MFGGFFDDIMGEMMDPFNMMGGRQRRSPMALPGSRGGFPGFGPMMPFGFPNINGMMTQMEEAMRNPGSFQGPGVVSHSVVQMSYDGSMGQPQIYQESSTTRQGPGGTRETRRTVMDTRAGVKKMAIGHHLDDRGRIVERQQDLRTNAMEENEELINLEDEEKDVFEREWQNRASMGHSARRAIDHRRPHHQRAEMLALPAASGSQPHSSKPSQLRKHRGPTPGHHTSVDRRNLHSYEPHSSTSTAVHPTHVTHTRPQSGSNRRQKREPRKHVNY